MVEDPIGFHPELSFLYGTLSPWNPLWPPLYWRCFKTPGSPDDHVPAVFKLPVSLYVSQGWGSGTCTDKDNRLCWFPHSGFEIPPDTGFLACSFEVILLRRLVSPQTSTEPGHPWASISLVLITVLSGSLGKFLPPFWGLWAYSLCLRNIYERSNVTLKLFLRKPLCLFVFVFVLSAKFAFQVKQVIKVKPGPSLIPPLNLCSTCIHVTLYCSQRRFWPW